MNKITVNLRNIILLVLFLSLSVTFVNAQNEKENSPKYKRASYKNEFVKLKNDKMEIILFKRIGGWGFGEISNSSGKFMAVLDHLGEIMVRDQDVPMRLEADEYEIIKNNEGQTLVFNVRSVVAREKLKGTSFDEWMRYPFLEPALTGTVSITLVKDEPLLKLKYDLESTGNYYATYIRGPWLKVGEDSFGTKKDDSIFPGVEWTINDEWSSGSDWFKDPWALKTVPHPNKVSIPMMAVSHEGTGIGLSWDPHQVATRWFNYREHNPQPVFATPNFIDRMNNSLMGIMIPDATIEGHENEVVAEQPIELKIGQKINFDCEIWLTEGRSLDVVTDWVKRNGLPDPGEPRWPFKETLDKIANAYNTNLWHEGEGFGRIQRPEKKIRANVPSFLERYVEENKGSKLAKELAEKIEWSKTQIKERNSNRSNKTADERGKELLNIQREDGSFYFDPDGRHYGKDDFRVATSFVEPMGLAFDTALDITILPVTQLLDIAKETGNDVYKNAAKKALEYCMDMTRPEGGDYWETPLHAPNLLAAGHAAVAYYEGYKSFNDERYLEKAIYWIRALIPFTHLWETESVPMLYNTKPCLCSSDWYFANWVRDHVQWEVLAVFAQSAERNINWAEVDKEIDWKRFHRGITTAAIRWINVHTDKKWRPHNLPSTLEAYERGDFDFCYPDTHNSTTGNYGGMMIMPAPIAENIYSLMDNGL